MNSDAIKLQKMTTLMQFARKAGKLVHGYEACLRALHQHKLYLMLVTEDTSLRTLRGIETAIQGGKIKVPILRAGDQASLSQALGIPQSGVFGIGDKQFASAIKTCEAAVQKQEEPCK